jgi:hypothetical protein
MVESVRSPTLLTLRSNILYHCYGWSSKSKTPVIHCFYFICLFINDLQISILFILYLHSYLFNLHFIYFVAAQLQKKKKKSLECYADMSLKLMINLITGSHSVFWNAKLQVQRHVVFLLHQIFKKRIETVCITVF